MIGSSMSGRWLDLNSRRKRLYRTFCFGVTGRFAPLRQFAHKTFRAPGRIQRFLLIQLKPKHHRLDVLTTHVTVCVCHAELKGYLLTRDETSWGENPEHDT